MHTTAGNRRDQLRVRNTGKAAQQAPQLHTVEPVRTTQAVVNIDHAKNADEHGELVIAQRKPRHANPLENRPRTGPPTRTTAQNETVRGSPPDTTKGGIRAH